MPRPGLDLLVQALQPSAVLASFLGVAALLIGLHLWATNGAGVLREPRQDDLAVTPATTLSLWWHHLWAGLFHKSWGHLAYNLAVLAVALPFATRQMGPLATLGNAYWIGPFVVFTLHLLLVLPLAHAGNGSAVRALDYPLVGFSVMAYSVAGAALTLAAPKVVAIAAAGIAVFEIVLALLGSTGPFIFAYHLGGLAMGFWVRTLLRPLA